MKMKRMTAILLASLMLILSACGGAVPETEPSKDDMQEDVQEYITQVVDTDAEITYFSVDDSSAENDTFTAACIVTYQSGDSGSKCVDKFDLTYAASDGEWELDKVSIDTEYEGRIVAEEEDTAEETADTSEASEPATESEPAATGTAQMSDDLSDYTFTLDGVVYQLPFAYTDLTADGWTISSTGNYESDTISGNSYSNITMAKSGNKISVDIFNLSGNAKTLAECKVGGIEVQRNQISDASFFTIAKGITTGSSKDEVVAAFGSANSTNDYDDWTTMVYGSTSNFEYVRFYTYKDDSEYNSIKMEYFVKSEDDTTETTSEVPEYLSSYTAPTELGDSPTSMNIKLDGKLYTLPAPLSEFTNDGWQITSKSDSVGSGNEDDVTVKKGDVTLYLYIKNFAVYQTIPENCAVIKVYIWDTDSVSMELPGGITIGSSKEDVDDWVTEDFEYYEGTYSYSYDYYNYDTDTSISVDVDVETGKVNCISVKREYWPY